MSKGPVGLEHARALPGLRLIALRGLPSPWTQAARGILRVKGIDYTLVHRLESDPPGLLEEWTGQASFPVAMYEDERPRSGWAEILLLAERLAPQPALVPVDPGDRALLFGLAHELGGEMGLGWCRRLEAVSAGMQGEPPDPLSQYLGAKYGYTPESAAAAPERILAILHLLSDRLAAERAQRNRFLMGPDLTALDIYWATFCNLVSPLPPERLPMPEAMRPVFTSSDARVHAILAEGLLAHRDFIYETSLELPVSL